MRLLPSSYFIYINMNFDLSHVFIWFMILVLVSLFIRMTIFVMFPPHEKCSNCLEEIEYTHISDCVHLKQFDIPSADEVYFNGIHKNICVSNSAWKSNEIVGMKFKSAFLCENCHYKKYCPLSQCNQKNQTIEEKYKDLSERLEKMESQLSKKGLRYDKSNEQNKWKKEI